MNDPEAGFDRMVGQYSQNLPGPGLIITGGLHGNEAGGLIAAQRVLRDLKESERPFKGMLTVLAGNLSALKENRRFINRDLNRHWNSAHLIELEHRPKDQLCSEDREQLELVALLKDLEKRPETPLIFLDLHTTSGQSPPFIVLNDLPPNRAIAAHIGLPCIVGFDKVLNCPMLSFLCQRGHWGLSIEGGLHGSAEAIDAHVSGIWLFLVATGAMREEDVPHFSAHQKAMRNAWPDAPMIFEICHRHVVKSGDFFVMRPGFKSFQPVHQNQVLAECDGVPIRSPADAVLLMPRYQPQGEDGFFLALPRPI